mmetsp:Transcript_5102/g.14816  ORF Transcript_5102/g.14816 Transcript_5102/m.14816 type:complete len:169 (-) Transcript_5102:99-605(-)
MDATARKQASKLGFPIAITLSPNSSRVDFSEYAPGSPWYATRRWSAVLDVVFALLVVVLVVKGRGAKASDICRIAGEARRRIEMHLAAKEALPTPIIFPDVISAIVFQSDVDVRDLQRHLVPLQRTRTEVAEASSLADRVALFVAPTVDAAAKCDAVRLYSAGSGLCS